MNYILLFGMPGGAEIIVILLVIIMFFGADKIPEFARMIGKGMREVKNATNDIQREIKESAAPITAITDQVDIKKQVTKLIKDDKDHAPATKEVVEKKKEVQPDISSEPEEVEEDQPSVTNTVSRKSPYTKEETASPKEEKE